MTPSLSMTCEVLDASDCSTSPTSTSLSQPESGCGSLPLTGTTVGRNRLCLTEDGGMTFRPSLLPRSSSDQPANSQTSYTHITIWTLSMETQDSLLPVVEKLKNENATLRGHIQMLEVIIANLRDKLVSTWGSC